MGRVRVICPGCGAGLAFAQAFIPGKLVDCPRRRLLFAPTAADVANSVARMFEVAAERDFADEAPPPGRYPSPSPYTWRRRYRSVVAGELSLVLIACVVMLVLASVVVGIYVLTITSWVHVTTTPPVTPAPTAVAVPAEPPPAQPPVVDVEVEDSRPLPKKPVPAIDDDPPVKP